MVEPLLWLYGRATDRGLFERPTARRIFERAYLSYKLFEAGPVSGLRAFVTPGSTVIDVGANIGFFTLKFAKWVGPGGRVIALEPEGRNAAALRRRVTRARMEGVVECIEAAAADHPGEVRLSLNPRHPGDHRLGAHGMSVRAVSIDELLAGKGDDVSLIKIDVQGAETMVLSGAKQLIRMRRPALFVELDDGALRDFGSSADELVGDLFELGYKAHALRRGGLSRSIAREEIAARTVGGAYIDVLFVPVSAAV